MNPIEDRDIRALRLALGWRGGASATELAQDTGVSVATVRRRLDALGTAITSYGRARATRYALRDPLDGLTDPLPLYEIDPSGTPAHIADLVPLAESKVLVLGHTADLPTEVHPDLPWFLDELRPLGYLGRQVPARHPGFPADIHHWGTRTVLSYAARYAWDAVGAFVLGNEALDRFGAAVREGVPAVPEHACATTWEAAADEAVRLGPIGSSAAGEQPKLLARRADPQGAVPVLVKWSPPVDGVAGERVADLLRAEAHALHTLAAHGVPAARARVITGRRRVLLEVERFDRAGSSGRFGQVSLAAADGAFVGSEGTWRASARGLHSAGHLHAEDARHVRLLDRFAALIGNSDRHLGNLSLRLQGARILGLTPAYDMAPMRWALVGGEVVEREPEVLPPLAEDADIEPQALAMATAHWDGLACDPDISPGFRAIAERGRRTMQEVTRLGRLAPPPTLIQLRGT